MMKSRGEQRIEKDRVFKRESISEAVNSNPQAATCICREALERSLDEMISTGAMPIEEADNIRLDFLSTFTEIMGRHLNSEKPEDTELQVCS
jgi:hypothetical protein